MSADAKAVIRNLNHTDPEIRRQAWEDLRNLGPEAMPIIFELAKTCPGFAFYFRMQGGGLLYGLAKPESASEFIVGMSDNDLEVRKFSACGLAATKDPRAFEHLVAALGDAELRRTAIFALGRLRDPRALDYL